MVLEERSAMQTTQGSEYWCVHVRIPLHAFLHRPHLVPQEVNTGVYMLGSHCMLSCIVLT